MKLRFPHLPSFFSKKKKLVIKGEAGLQGNITHFVLFSVMSATDASRSDRRFPVVCHATEPPTLGSLSAPGNYIFFPVLFKEISCTAG